MIKGFCGSLIAASRAALPIVVLKSADAAFSTAAVSKADFKANVLTARFCSRSLLLMSPMSSNNVCPAAPTWERKGCPAMFSPFGPRPEAS